MLLSNSYLDSPPNTTTHHSYGRALVRQVFKFHSTSLMDMFSFGSSYFAHILLILQDTTPSAYNNTGWWWSVFYILCCPAAYPLPTPPPQTTPSAECGKSAELQLNPAKERGRGTGQQHVEGKIIKQ